MAKLTPPSRGQFGGPDCGLWIKISDASEAAASAANLPLVWPRIRLSRDVGKWQAHEPLLHRRLESFPRHQPLLGLCPLQRLRRMAFAFAYE
jgi:hypothetical protein